MGREWREERKEDGRGRRSMGLEGEEEGGKGKEGREGGKGREGGNGREEKGRAEGEDAGEGPQWMLDTPLDRTCQDLNLYQILSF